MKTIEGPRRRSEVDSPPLNSSVIDLFARDISNRDKLRRELEKWERLAAVGALASKVAHEIRNPLSAISLHAELLEDELASSDQGMSRDASEALETILREVHRLSEIVEEYLRLGRMPEGDPMPLDLEELVTSVVGLVVLEFQRDGVQITSEIPPRLPVVHGYPAQIRQMLLNLLRNAREAMPDGGWVNVVLGVEAGYVVIRIEDEGPGVPPTEIENVFDPFFTTKQWGTGLGLALVRQVAERHGGSVSCLSSKTGAVFTVQLPLEPAT